jgi:hypothetical protein
MIDYVFCASDYNKMWCSLQKQTHVMVLCKTSTNMWCYMLFPLERAVRQGPGADISDRRVDLPCALESDGHTTDARFDK